MLKKMNKPSFLKLITRLSITQAKIYLRDNYTRTEIIVKQQSLEPLHHPLPTL